MSLLANSFPYLLCLSHILSLKRQTTDDKVYFCKIKKSLVMSYTVKNIRGFNGKITGNQLPVHFPLFFTGAHEHFQESGTER